MDMSAQYGLPAVRRFKPLGMNEPLSGSRHHELELPSGSDRLTRKMKPEIQRDNMVKYAVSEKQSQQNYIINLIGNLVSWTTTLTTRHLLSRPTINNSATLLVNIIFLLSFFAHDEELTGVCLERGYFPGKIQYS